MTETRQEFCTPALVVSGMRVCVRYCRCVRFSIPSSTGSDVCELIDHNTPRIDVMSLIFRCLSKHRVICLMFVRHCLRRVSPGSHFYSAHTHSYSLPHTLVIPCSLIQQEAWRIAWLRLNFIPVAASSYPTHSLAAVTLFPPRKSLTRLPLFPLPQRATSCVFYVLDTRLS
jgi:hypothetical protein